MNMFVDVFFVGMSWDTCSFANTSSTNYAARPVPTIFRHHHWGLRNYIAHLICTTTQSTLIMAVEPAVGIRQRQLIGPKIIILLLMKFKINPYCRARSFSSEVPVESRTELTTFLYLLN